MQSPGVEGVLAVGSERETLAVVEIQEVPHANATSDMGLGQLAVARSRTVGGCRQQIVGKLLVVGKCRLAGETVSSGCRERGYHQSRRLCCFRGFGIGDEEAAGGEDGGNMKKKGRRVLFFC
ncbi:hypothetical protein TIFTF001_034719 [Ficus carica]|uniref:Uncharacterized protein n=1 Tax=Ficus carica TaxID=3494 RepID=A0AA88E0A6_FICCA|nr:hypothetical protein TIFTF001_034719 [Ficus carica]